MMGGVIAIGNFDGVHRGHQAILRAARQAAGSGTVTAVTFWPHPLLVLRPDHAPDLLCELSDRVSLLRHYGADEVSIIEFTPEVAQWSPTQFLDEVVLPLGADVVVVGQNFRFSAGAKADPALMRDLAHSRFDVQVLPLLTDGGEVSSTRVREALAHGDPQLAQQMLGRWFRYWGIVVMGDQRGRTLGYPTANLTVGPHRACPADGVYAGYLTQGTRRWSAAISVGTNPTFDGHQRRVEAYALDQTDLSLYGSRVGVDFVQALRGQRRFSSRDELIGQMGADVERAREVLGALVTQGD